MQKHNCAPHRGRKIHLLCVRCMGPARNCKNPTSYGFKKCGRSDTTSIREVPPLGRDDPASSERRKNALVEARGRMARREKQLRFFASLREGSWRLHAILNTLITAITAMPTILINSRSAYLSLLRSRHPMTFSPSHPWSRNPRATRLSSVPPLHIYLE